MKDSLEKIISLLGRDWPKEIHTPIIVGGWALNYLGFSRNTLDFDMMIFEQEFPVIEKIIAKQGYEKSIQTPLYARFCSKENLKLPYIDCLFADKSTYGKIRAEGTIIDVFGAEFILPKVTHIIAMKLHAVKHGEQSRLGKDFEDIIALIEIHDLDISRESDIYALCERYADDDIYRRITDAVSGK